MKLAYLSPLPPARTGIAHYSAMLLPALKARVDVTAFAHSADFDRNHFDSAIYQLGNNPHHEWIYREAMEKPGIAVLHDVVLHHLIVEMTLARGDVDAYVAALEENHGPAGAAWARGRAAGLHSEMGNFLMPASIALANRSRAVIVHNRWAADRLRSFGVGTPIQVVPHPYLPDARPADRDGIRQKLGFRPIDRVIGFFGFLTSAKRAEVVLEAFEAARAKEPRLKLLIVGEAAPNIDADSLRGDGVVLTGYVSDEEFGSYYAASDRLVNLRYPSAGETSGTLIRAFEAGKPVAVSDYAQFAEYPDDCVVKIPFGAGEVEALSNFLIADLDDGSFAKAQRQWLEANARMEMAVDGYVAAVADAAREERPAVQPALPLFTQLRLVGVDVENDTLRMTIRNAGSATVCTRTYGAPEYRIVAKLYDGDREVHDRWIALPRDLRPGSTVTLGMPLLERKGRFSLRLYDGIQGIPAIDPQPWASVEIAL